MIIRFLFLLSFSAWCLVGGILGQSMAEVQEQDLFLDIKRMHPKTPGKTDHSNMNSKSNLKADTSSQNSKNNNNNNRDNKGNKVNSDTSNRNNAVRSDTEPLGPAKGEVKSQQKGTETRPVSFGKAGSRTPLKFQIISDYSDDEEEEENLNEDVGKTGTGNRQGMGSGSSFSSIKVDEVSFGSSNNKYENDFDSEIDYEVGYHDGVFKASPTASSNSNSNDNNRKINQESSLDCRLYDSGNIINSRVLRTIDATTNAVKVQVMVNVSNLSGGYQFILTQEQEQHLSFLKVEATGTGPLTISPCSIPAQTESSAIDRYSRRLFIFDKSVKSVIFSIQMIFLGTQRPFPKEIEQLQNQKVVLSDNHVFLSPYFTKTQRAIFKLGSPYIDSFTKRQPSAVKNNSIAYGPYVDIPPYEYTSTVMSYVNNYPFASITALSRRVSVNLLQNNLKMEDIVDVRHHGAALLGIFSKYLHDLRSKEPASHPWFGKLKGRLPIESHHHYFKDQIANISTVWMKTENKICSQNSNETCNSSKEIIFEFETRFPLYGGWGTQFFAGFFLPIGSVLSVYKKSIHYENEIGNVYELKLPMGNFIDSTWVRHFNFEITFPAGSKVLSYNDCLLQDNCTASIFPEAYKHANVSYERDPSQLSDKHFFSIAAPKHLVTAIKFATRSIYTPPLVEWFYTQFPQRPILQINATNLSEEHRNLFLTTRFFLPNKYKFLFPLMLSSVFFGLLIVLSILSRLAPLQNLSQDQQSPDEQEDMRSDKPKTD